MPSSSVCKISLPERVSRQLPGVLGEGGILFKLKCICASKSRYPRIPQSPDSVRAVDLTTSRLEVDDIQPGRCSSPRSRSAQLASLVGYWRRQLTLTILQAQCRLLLGRLQLLGNWTAKAERRRDRAMLVGRYPQIYTTSHGRRLKI